MEYYFDTALPQLIARVDQALIHIPNELSKEQAVLAAKCSEQLGIARDGLEQLMSAPYSDVENRTERIRAFQRIVRDIEYVETVGLAALERSNKVDERLARLVEAIRREINYPLQLPPAVTAISRDYFYVHTRFKFNLICVPPGERHSLLHLPDLYHELAHPLLTERDPAHIRAFHESRQKIRDNALAHFLAELQEERRKRGPAVYKDRIEEWMQNWYRSWSTEFLCDIFAVYSLGPAFAWAHYHLCVKKTENPFIASRTHPADHARMKIILFALDRSGHFDAANEIDAKWTELLASTGNVEGHEFAECYPRKLLGDVADIGFEGVGKMKIRIATPDTTDTVHNVLNEAWSKFWALGSEDSYAKWEKDAVEALYESCHTGGERPRDVVSPPSLNRSRSFEVTSQGRSAKDVFKESLTSLIGSVSWNSEVTRAYPFLSHPDILQVELIFEEPPRGGIYDHAVFERKFYLSEDLLKAFDTYWESRSTTENARMRMCKLFFLHEFLHTEQHVDSNSYKYSKDSKSSFRYIDYDADAFAVEISLLLDHREAGWSATLADVLAAHVWGGEVFAVADDGAKSLTIAGERLWRQTIWNLQYARARSFPPELSVADFEIRKQFSVEIFRIGVGGHRENLCVKDVVTLEDFRDMLEIHLVWGGRRFRYPLTNRHYVDSFIKGIFDGNLDTAVEAFRPLFDDRPELVGRGFELRRAPAGPPAEVFNRTEFIRTLYSLHVDDVGKIVTVLPGAMDKISSAMTKAKKIEQLIEWAESGSGPGIHHVYLSAQALMPELFRMPTSKSG
ncbi:MAG: hypothetical protein ABL984_10250 [Pyrinomonadaceae bacterium]